jgi:Mn2+/Fe2+ NRAMP family transporter
LPDAVPGVDVGRQRSQAIYRVLAALILFTIGAPVLAVLFLVATIAGVVLLVVGLAVALWRNERWSGGMLHDWSMRLFAWPFDIIWWIFSGKTTDGSSSFPWMP